MKTIKKLINPLHYIYILLAFVIFLPAVICAEPGAPTTLSISPAIIEIKVDPGKEKTETITIINNEDSPIAVRIYAQNFQATNIFGDLAFDTNSNDIYSALTWLQIEKPNLVIAPQQSEKIKVKLKVPTNAEPGDHNAVIFFEPMKIRRAGDKSVLNITGRVGALLFTTINGQIFEKGRVLGAVSSEKCDGVQCSFKTKKLYNWGPVPYEFKFENTGNVHVKVKGKIEIFGTFGEKVGEILVDEKTVLPRSVRYFETTWLREPLLGRYTAKLTLNYGSLKVTERAQVSFWAFPWKLAVPILILALFAYIFRMLQTKKRARMNKNGMQSEKS